MVSDAHSPIILSWPLPTCFYPIFVPNSSYSLGIACIGGDGVGGGFYVFYSHISFIRHVCNVVRVRLMKICLRTVWRNAAMYGIPTPGYHITGRHKTLICTGLSPVMIYL